MALQRRFREHYARLCVRHGLLIIAFIASLYPLLSRFQEQSSRTPGFGWEAVATEGDDDVDMEMTEGR